ncbi:MAG: alanine--tRNA ligase-related protein, partial [bacterium]|nr:alanine--tRNA ligase-related protein [bacterium]
MESSEIRKRFLEFFKARGHTIVPSSSLIPDDPSVLLTTAGMQQFKKYYTGEADPMKDFGSKSTVSVQKSFRTSDIDEVGDETHLTFFEMLGNFSFGGYFKEDAIKLAYDFFKSINLSIQYVTVFEGDKDVPADKESEDIWKRLGVTDIRRHGRADNFWGPTGSEGPCGPTTEIYVRDTEIWNIVFNQYYCRPNKTLEPLKQSGVDTGMGLERLAMVLQGKSNIFETDLFQSTLECLGDIPLHSKRIIADHARGLIFLIADGVRPGNKDRSYILRALIRRAASHLKEFRPLRLTPEGETPQRLITLHMVIEGLIEQYGSAYPYLLNRHDAILSVFTEEVQRFNKVFEDGEKLLQDVIRSTKKSGSFKISGKEAFDLVSTHGLVLEWVKDTARVHSLEFDLEGYNSALEKHKEISRAGQEKKFGGHGLILDTGELKAGSEEELRIVTRLHTATHLLNAALRKV